MEPPRYSHDGKMTTQHDHLPAQWTPVDQEIIEDLLLVEPAPHEAYANASMMPPQSPPLSSMGTVYPGQMMPPTHPQYECITPPLQQHETMIGKQHFYPYFMGQVLGSDETRKAKHREEQIKRTKQLAKQLEMKYGLLQLSSEKGKLETENEALEKSVAATGVDFAILSKEQIELVLEDQLKTIKEHYTPITDDEWSELLKKNIDDYEVTSREPNYVSTGITVMGWSDRRKQESSSMKFIMSKQFPHLNAENFMNTTWAKLWLQETHSSLFNAAVAIKVHFSLTLIRSLIHSLTCITPVATHGQIQILQQINEDTIVLHRAFFNPQTNGVVHAIETLCRIQHGLDYIVFLRSPDRDPIGKCVANAYDWVKIWTSLVYSPLPARHGVSGCMFRYGGWMRDFAAPDVKYWLMEMLWVLLRFESVMVSPIFSLPPQDT